MPDADLCTCRLRTRWALGSRDATVASLPRNLRCRQLWRCLLERGQSRRPTWVPDEELRDMGLFTPTHRGSRPSTASVVTGVDEA